MIRNDDNIHGIIENYVSGHTYRIEHWYFFYNFYFDLIVRITDICFHLVNTTTVK